MKPTNHAETFLDTKAADLSTDIEAKRHAASELDSQANSLRAEADSLAEQRDEILEAKRVIGAHHNEHASKATAKTAKK